eukprot:5552369-Prymnesium_polylepis.1
MASLRVCHVPSFLLVREKVNPFPSARCPVIRKHVLSHQQPTGVGGLKWDDFHPKTLGARTSAPLLVADGRWWRPGAVSGATRPC